VKKEKGKIKLGGFELFCLILFAYPLLFIPMFMSALSNLESMSQLFQNPLLIFFVPSLVLSVVLLIYNLYNPLMWINMKIEKKWKLCAILSLITLIIALANPLMGSTGIGYFIFKFIFWFIGAFLLFTGANTLALFLQGKAVFKTSNSKK